MAIGLTLDARIVGIVLPVGISFYTFQSLSYTIDIYRRELKPTRHFADFALFVAFFPQLVAGPIERARVLLPQISSTRTITREQIEEGLWLILSGYYLKVVLADNLAPFTQEVFGDPGAAAGLQVMVAIYAAAFQIYGDFAGYSRIARGISKLMGIELMRNFRRPYFATSPSDFWRRWHISLSTWLRDYLYIPLGGSRGGTGATYRNLMLTMLLGGLWHGAAWNFVVWGLFHGLILSLWRAAGWERTSIETGASHKTATRLVKVVVFFHVTCVGWLLFFVKSLGDVNILLTQMVTKWQWNGQLEMLTLFLFAAPVVGMEWMGDSNGRVHGVLGYPRPLRLAVYSGVTLAILLLGAVEQYEFIYFQF